MSVFTKGVRGRRSTTGSDRREELTTNATAYDSELGIITQPPGGS